MNEKKLLQRAREKDRLAVAQLVQSYQQVLFTLCMGYVHNTDEAKDLVQETFIKFFNNLEQFRGEASVKTWLFRIAANTCLNYLRDNKKHRNHITVHELKTDVPHPENTEQKMDQQQIKKALEQAINKLPEKQKRAFVLYKYNDLSHKEIAAIEKTTVAAVESLLHRANRNLRKSLEKFYNNFNT